MNEQASAFSGKALLWTFGPAGAAVTLGALLGVAIRRPMDGGAQPITWSTAQVLNLGSLLIGPFLSVAFSLSVGTQARGRSVWVPAVGMLGGLSSLLPVQPLNPWLLLLSLAAFVVVVAASRPACGAVRAIASVVCGAGLAALNVWASSRT